jgi:hypothetical protein
MANINERIQQALTRHEIDVLRYEQGQVKEAVAHLNNLQAQLVNEIKRAEPVDAPYSPPERRSPSTRWQDCGHKNWAAEPGVGRVAHGVPNRVDRIKGLGNAIVPQIAEYFALMLEPRLVKEYA